MYRNILYMQSILKTLHYKIKAMQALIQSLEQKTGLTPEKARQAVTHVLDFLKSKLPPQLHEHLDSAASGNNLQNSLGSMAGKLGGIFGS